ncbi:hypothetical protein [Treponema pedis]|uniref:hypothetical protein n=1 Tax=Treponema pedis TaxID=409322 RepID=UPI00197E1417|nr:hypothetical protein [Treponema pedis]QSI05724.1 hypothetical protein DYQ05_12830 [Treponema pedis]
MNKQRKSNLIAGITVLLGLMFLTACPVKPASSEKQTDKKEETQADKKEAQENILNTVWEAEVLWGDSYPETNSEHYYIYIGEDGTIYEAIKALNQENLRKPNPDLFGTVKFKNNKFTVDGKEVPHKVTGDILTVGDFTPNQGNFNLKAKRITSPTGEEIKNAPQN